MSRQQRTVPAPLSRSGRRVRLQVMALYLIALAASAVSCTSTPHEPSHNAHAGHHTTSSQEASVPSEMTQGCDAEFIAAMIPHHEQAVQISALAPARAANPQIVNLAEAIIRQQRVEVAIMTDWAHAEGITAGGGHHAGATAHDHPAEMPGMLTQEEIDALALATGSSFDSMFLRDMIRHHRGALTMVDQILGSTHSVAVQSLAVDTGVEQRFELIAMRRLQIELETGRRPSQATMAQRAATGRFDDPLPARMLGGCGA